MLGVLERLECIEFANGAGERTPAVFTPAGMSMCPCVCVCVFESECDAIVYGWALNGGHAHAQTLSVAAARISENPLKPIKHRKTHSNHHGHWLNDADSDSDSDSQSLSPKCKF